MVYGLFVVVIGLCVGSFVNMLVSRLPDPRRSLFRPLRSACPKCDAPIEALDNIPVVSWLLLRGKCRSCRAPISRMYPIVEILVGASAWMGYRIWQQSEALLPGPVSDAFHTKLMIMGAVVAVYLTLLVAIAATDWQSFVIPDVYTVGGAAFMLTANAYLSTPATAGHLALDALTMGLGLYLFGRLMTLILKKDALGSGDAFFLAFIATSEGFGGACAVLYLAAISGLITEVWRTRIRPRRPAGDATSAALLAQAAAAAATATSAPAVATPAMPAPAADEAIDPTWIPFGLHLALGAVVFRLLPVFLQSCLPPEGTCTAVTPLLTSLFAMVNRLNQFLPWHV